jgi:hypothetical protein
VSNLVVSVTLNLLPLARAFELIGEEMKEQAIRRGIDRGIAKFKSAAHKALKDETKIRRPSRLKVGVRTIPAHWSVSGGGFVGEYRIRDRNIRITTAYFGASYVRKGQHGKPGARARWGRSAGTEGATWTSWDGARLGNKTFMMPGKKIAFLRLKKHGDKLTPAWGPNPAEMMRLRAPRFQRILVDEGNKEVHRQARITWDRAHAKARSQTGT